MQSPAHSRPAARWRPIAAISVTANLALDIPSMISSPWGNFWLDIPRTNGSPRRSFQLDTPCKMAPFEHTGQTLVGHPYSMNTVAKLHIYMYNDRCTPRRTPLCCKDL